MKALDDWLVRNTPHPTKWKRAETRGRTQAEEEEEEERPCAQGDGVARAAGGKKWRRGGEGVEGGSGRGGGKGEMP